MESALIKHTALAHGLNDTQCNLLASIAHELTLESGEILFSEGDIDPRLFVLLEGKLAVTRTRGHSWETLHMLTSGDLAGESAFMDANNVHGSTLRAIGTVKVAYITRDDFEALLNQDPMLVYLVMRAIIISMRKIMKRVSEQCSQLSHYVHHHDVRR